MAAPLDPLAATTASLIAGAALAKDDQLHELASWPGLAALVARVHQAAINDPALLASLAEISLAPTNPARVTTLAHAIAARTSEEAGLRAELQRLLDQARQHPTAGGLVTQVAGHAQVGTLVTIGQAGDIHLHLPPAPALTTLNRLRRGDPAASVANLPARNLAFTGRENQLATLGERLAAGAAAAVVQPQAVHGLGGVGKTHLVLEYAHRHLDHYRVIWWINAEEPLAIPGQLVALARRLGIPEAADQTQTIQALWDELRHLDHWLLVFDNVEQSQDVRPFWPPGNGHTLVTSRNPAWGDLAATVALDVPPRAEAVAFLHRRSDVDQQAAGALAEALGDLPLALEQAAAYLDQTATSAGEYLELLGERADDLLIRGRPATEQTIATTWKVSLQRLREQAPAAEGLLVVCAFLAADGIPRALLTGHPEQLPERLGSITQDPIAYQGTIGALRRYALVKASGDELSVHRLVQVVVRAQLDLDQFQAWAATALSLVHAAFPADPTDSATWPSCARLLPHALAVTDHAEAAGPNPETTVRLLNQAALYLWERADHDQARALLERALTAWEAHLGADHPDTATTLHNLGLILHDQGDLATARTSHERALRIRERRPGRDHPETAMSLNNLARVLRDLGDLDQARELLERALVVFEARYGADHRDTTWTLHNLGLVLHDQGDLVTARAYHERALAIREALLGPNDLDIAWGLNHLARVVSDQGDRNQARELLERALTIDNARNPNHPNTARSLNDLANILASQGDLERAHNLLERALHIREVGLGPDHPDTRQSRHDLARVLAELEDRS
jgi:tetratricopeptide (TPR) repeat protein